VTVLVGLSTPATIALILGLLVGLGFVGALLLPALRRRLDSGPDIPRGMRPGPPDEILERRHPDRTMAWGVVFTVIIAVSVAGTWLTEPSVNVADAEELLARSAERGSRWFQEANEENPTGFGCARCHGQQAEGGQVPFTQENGETVLYPVPSLSDVCGRLTIEGPGQIRETIEQGREGTPMPSWSVRYAGAMNDQQIQDLIQHLLSLQEMPPDQNQCLNPPAAGETA
jgi:mono/diheme cytochrome c family protein